MQIAIVEDNPQTLQRLCAVLGQQYANAVISSFLNLKTALPFAKTQPQDYWLVDLGLPDGSGIQLIRSVRQHFPQANILVISVFDNVDNILNSIQAGANGYLLKDALDEDLVGALSAIESGGTPLSPMIASRLLERMLPATDLHPAVKTKGQTPTLAKAQANIPADKQLTEREIELLNLLARGYAYLEAADFMQIAVSTVQTYVRHIYAKLEVHSRAEAIFEARALGMLAR